MATGTPTDVPTGRPRVHWRSAVGGFVHYRFVPSQRQERVLSTIHGQCIGVHAVFHTVLRQADVGEGLRHPQATAYGVGARPTVWRQECERLPLKPRNHTISTLKSSSDREYMIAERGTVTCSQDAGRTSVSWW